MTSRQNQSTMAAICEPGGLPGISRSDLPRGLLMKSLKLIGLALGASLALSTTALAQDITIAVAGPMTGGESAFGRQMKNGAELAVTDLNAAGGVEIRHRQFGAVLHLPAECGFAARHRASHCDGDVLRQRCRRQR